MAKVALVIVGIAALGVALFLVVNTERDALERRQGGVAPFEDAPVGTGAAIESRATAETTPTTKVAPAPFREADPTGADAAVGPWIVTGTVVTPDEKPVPGITVLVRLVQGDENAGETKAQGRVVTDANGAFRCGLATPKEAITVVARAEHPEYECFAKSASVTGEGSPPPPFVLKVEPFDASIVGTVKSLEGKTVSGATIGWGREVKADELGAFRFPVVSRSREVWLGCRAPGYAPKQVQIQAPAPGATARCDFALSPEGVVTGTVKRRDGTPVERARVGTWTVGRKEDAVTSVDGIFRLGGFDPEQKYNQIVVDAPGCFRVVARVEFQGRDATVDVIVDSGVEISGMTVDKNGAPVGGALVAAGEKHSMERVEITSDAGGHFRFPAVKPGRVALRARRRGFCETEKVLDVPIERGAVADLRFELLPSHSVGGRVVDKNGTPVAGLALAGCQHGDYIEPRARTDKEGKFVMNDLPDSGVQLEIYGQGWLRVRKDVEVDRQDHVLTIERAAKIGGRVIDAATKLPVKRFTIRLISPELEPNEQEGGGYSSHWSEQGQIFDGTDGYWAMDSEDLTPGAVFGVEARSVGYAVGRAPHVVATTDFNKDLSVIALTVAAPITGVVRSKVSNEPVPEAVVFVMTPEEYERHKQESWREPSLKAKSDVNGAFVMESAPLGPLFVEVHHTAFAPTVVGPLPAASGATPRTVTVLMETGGRVIGALIGPNGSPVAGATIVARPMEVPGVRYDETHSNRTTPSGRFTIDGLAPGLWDVGLGAADGTGESLTRQVKITAGETKEIRLANDGACSLAVTIESPEPLPAHTWLTLHRDGTTGTEDADGHETRRLKLTGSKAEFSGVAPGTYTASLSSIVENKRHFSGFGFVTLTGGSKELTIKVRIAEVK